MITKASKTRINIAYEIYCGSISLIAEMGPLNIKARSMNIKDEAPMEINDVVTTVFLFREVSL
jgi:hypothetical protein